MAAAVNDRSAAVSAMALDWDMLEALMGGTRVMRSKGETYLPKWTLEHPLDHTARLNVATLFPAYQRTVSVMVGKPFAKAITLSDDTPPEIQQWAEDIDNEGVSLHVFAAEMFAETFYGLAGILVEAPKAIEPKGGTVTKADQMEAGVRPYFVRVLHNQILGWRVAKVNGKATLTQLRIKETATVDDGDFGEKEVERVRVLTPGAFEVWEKSRDASGKDSWTSIEQGTTGLDVIPFVPLYGRRKGFMCGHPPLLDLAFLNVKHWQEQSDQDDGVMYARKRLIAIIGDDKKGDVVASSSGIMHLPIGGDIKVAQGSAENVKIGMDSLKALEEQMIQAGAELLVKKPGDRSATEAANDAEANKSDLQRLVENFEDSLDQALWLMARYANLKTGGNVSLFKDFGAANLSEASGQLVLVMRGEGLISDETAIGELKRRGELSAEVDAQDEADKIAAQPPPLGMVPAQEPNAMTDPARATA